MIYQIIGTLVLFCVVLSWTDLKSHVVYAFIVSSYEGWWKFPLIWLQSFFIPIQFLSTMKNTMDYDSISLLERAARNLLSNNPHYSITKNSGNTFIIRNADDGDEYVAFAIPKDDCSSINGSDRIVPPRIAFLILACIDKFNSSGTSSKSKPSIFD